MTSISVIGTGYVGVLTAVGMSKLGFKVACYDVDKDKIEKLRAGIVPFYEPGLTELLVTELKNGLSFHNTINSDVMMSEIFFFCVGTPASESGGADLTQLNKAVVDIALNVVRDSIFVIKSTVPVGTGDAIEEDVNAITAETHSNAEIALVSNPEFLREGSAVNNFFHPDRVVVGADNEVAGVIIHALYNGIVAPKFNISRRAAEMCKHGANAFLAMRITFINELANICDAHQVDIHEVKKGMCSDSRVGSHFMWPGTGYGGSCFPKDVRALASVARDADYYPPLIQTIDVSNERQKHILLDKLIKDKGEEWFKGKTFCVWGVTFKHETDDIRESPAILLVDRLLQLGGNINFYDPQGADNFEAVYAGRYAKRVHLHEEKCGAARTASALFIMTDWAEFRQQNLNNVRALMRERIICDGRNMLNPLRVAMEGFAYYSIGRDIAAVE